MEEDILLKLDNIELAEHEAATIPIITSDIRKSADECSRSLFEKIHGTKKANIAGLRRALNHLWQIRSSVSVRELNPNYFQFIFSDKEDKVKVSKGANWTYENQYLILQEWAEGISENHPGFQEVDIWVQAWNIPLHWLSSEVGIKLGSVFKQVKDVSVPQGGNLAGKCLRLLVTLDVNKPLLRCTHIQLEEKKILVQFKYERLVSLCFYCGHLGHLDRNCDKRMADIAAGNLREGLYGDWLKATESFFSHHINSSHPNPSPLSYTDNPINTLGFLKFQASDLKVEIPDQAASLMSTS
ncbi:Unknown protein [Striga hermonthica]|uniref:CCHC-type domain-containing protein n=1 Tax=Striga hermonthica TaxID=68872 RepID=A0A9N7N5M3_STRHE|nr:Unknown protein [Striga hermonthica]